MKSKDRVLHGFIFPSIETALIGIKEICLSDGKSIFVLGFISHTWPIFRTSISRHQLHIQFHQNLLVIFPEHLIEPSQAALAVKGAEVQVLRHHAEGGGNVILDDYKAILQVLPENNSNIKRM